MKYAVRLKGSGYFVQSSPGPMAHNRRAMRLTADVLDASLYSDPRWARQLRRNVMPVMAGEVVSIEGGVLAVIPDTVPPRSWWKCLFGKR